MVRFAAVSVMFESYKTKRGLSILCSYEIDKIVQSGRKSYEGSGLHHWRRAVGAVAVPALASAGHRNRGSGKVQPRICIEPDSGGGAGTRLRPADARSPVR